MSFVHDGKVKGLVSVIVPVYNRSAMLREALQSVLSQTYRNLEVIVVDDGSEEDIRSVVDQLRGETDFPLIYIRQEHQGPGVARRRGLKQARGEFIQYLDSDDLLLPEKIEHQVLALERDPGAVMCYCVSKYLLDDGNEKLLPFSDSLTADLLEGVLSGRPWHTIAALWRYPQGCTPLWPNMFNYEDIVHDISVGLTHRHVVFVPEVLAVVRRVHSQRLSSTPGGVLSRLQIENVYRSLKLAIRLVKAVPDEKYGTLLWRMASTKAMVFLRSGYWWLCAKLLLRSIKVAPNFKFGLYSIGAALIVILTRGRAPRRYIRKLARMLGLKV